MSAMNIKDWISSKVTCNVTFCLEHLERNANLHETLSICIVNEMINVTYIYLAKTFLGPVYIEMGERR